MALVQDAVVLNPLTRHVSVFNVCMPPFVADPTYVTVEVVLGQEVCLLFSLTSCSQSSKVT